MTLQSTIYGNSDGNSDRLATAVAKVATGLAKVATPVATVATPVATLLPPRPTSDEEVIDAGRKLLALKLRLAGRFMELFEGEQSYSYRSAARWMQAARDAGRANDALAGFRSDPRPAGMPTINPADRRELGRWVRQHAVEIAQKPVEALGEVARIWPLATYGDLAASFSVEVAEREAELAELRRANGQFGGMPADALPAMSLAGREAINAADTKHRAPHAPAVAAGDAGRARLYEAAISEWCAAANAALAMLIGGLEGDDAADPRSLRSALSAGGIWLDAPSVPASEGELASIVDGIKRKAADAGRQRSIEAAIDEWDDRRYEAGMAMRCELPPELQAALDRHVDGLDDRWTGLFDFWPNVPALPLEEFRTCGECGTEVPR